MSTQWPLFTLPCFHSCRMSYSETLKHSSAEGFHCMFRLSALPLSLAKVVFVFYYFYVCLKKVKLTVGYCAFYHKWSILRSRDLTKNLLHSDKHRHIHLYSRDHGPKEWAQNKTRAQMGAGGPLRLLWLFFICCGCFVSFRDKLVSLCSCFCSSFSHFPSLVSYCKSHFVCLCSLCFLFWVLPKCLCSIFHFYLFFCGFFFFVVVSCSLKLFCLSL